MEVKSMGLCIFFQEILTQSYGVIPPAVFTLSEFPSVLQKYLHSSRWIAYCPESENTALTNPRDKSKFS